MPKQLLAFLWLVSTPFFLFSFVAKAEGEFPKNLTCLKKGVELPIMNEQVLKWKKETANQYLDRALISGRVEKVFLIRKSHVQIDVTIGENKNENIELIYNREFGDLPKVTKGMRVEACGDYITSRAPAGGYPASPAGAIIHWVHMNPAAPGPKRHDDGFVVLDGVMYGTFNPGPKDQF